MRAIPPAVLLVLLAICAPVVVAGPWRAVPLPPTLDWTAEIDQDWAHLGHAAASAGDVNNDGYDDLIAGAASFDGGQIDEGVALLYLGTPDGLSTAPPGLPRGIRTMPTLAAR